MIHFQSVNLSFPFPLFGGVVRNLTVTTAGALITGNSEDKLRLPSHIAPFLTNIPLSENDKTVFYDTGINTILRNKNARYIQVKVEHYLLFMFSPPKIS